MRPWAGIRVRYTWSIGADEEAAGARGDAEVESREERRLPVVAELQGADLDAAPPPPFVSVSFPGHLSPTSPPVGDLDNPLCLSLARLIDLTFFSYVGWWHRSVALCSPRHHSPPHLCSVQHSPPTPHQPLGLGVSRFFQAHFVAFRPNIVFF